MELFGGYIYLRNGYPQKLLIERSSVFVFFFLKLNLIVCNIHNSRYAAYLMMVKSPPTVQKSVLHVHSVPLVSLKISILDMKIAFIH